MFKYSIEAYFKRSYSIVILYTSYRIAHVVVGIRLSRESIQLKHTHLCLLLAAQIPSSVAHTAGTIRRETIGFLRWVSRFHSSKSFPMAETTSSAWRNTESFNGYIFNASEKIISDVRLYGCFSLRKILNKRSLIVY